MALPHRDFPNPAFPPVSLLSFFSSCLSLPPFFSSLLVLVMKPRTLHMLGKYHKAHLQGIFSSPFILFSKAFFKLLINYSGTEGITQSWTKLRQHLPCRGSDNVHLGDYSSSSARKRYRDRGMAQKQHMTCMHRPWVLSSTRTKNNLKIGTSSQAVVARTFSPST